MTEELRTGPSIKPLQCWYYQHKRYRVERLSWYDDTLYVVLDGDSWLNEDKILVPASNLLREGSLDGYPYPTTWCCEKEGCEMSSTATENELEVMGWGRYGFGSPTLCPAHAEECRNEDIQR